MVRETIWMRYLLIGISSIFLIIISSCGQEDVDCLVESEFVLINETDFRITTSNGTILQDDTLSISSKYLGNCDVNTNDFIPPISQNVIRLDETKCKIYNIISKNEGEGPFGISNYTTEKISNLNFKFTYIFKNEDFDSITDCE